MHIQRKNLFATVAHVLVTHNNACRSFQKSLLVWFGKLECVWSGDDTGTTGTTILSSVAKSENTVIPNGDAGHMKKEAGIYKNKRSNFF